MGKPLEIALPDFGAPLDRTEHNRRLQAYRSWAYEQRFKGRPIPCWCLYIWIKGNNKDASRERVRAMRKPRHRPEGITPNQWKNWRHHQRRGGLLSFQEYLVRYNENAKKGQGFREDLVGVPLEKRSIRRGSAYRVDEKPKKVEVMERPKTWPRHANGKRMEQPAIPGDQGLRMEPKAVIAKINRLLEAQKSRGR